MMAQILAIDYNNNIILTGFFSGTNVDSRPTAGSFPMTSNFEDQFLAKYTSSGNLVWAKKMGGNVNNNETIRQLAVDLNGDIYVTGFFSTTADFDPDAGTQVLNATSVHEGFIAKYSSFGSWLWAYQFGGTGFSQGDGE